MTEVDLAIIGSGSGNSLITPELDDKSIAIIDHGIFGGTCLNVGCIPTKMFVYAADVASTIRGSSKYGVDSTLDQVRWADIRDRIFNRIDPISEAGLEYRKNGEPNTRAYVGTATFVGSNELSIETENGPERLRAKQIVLASGSRPYIPKVIADSGVKYETSDSVMRLEKLPESILIYGGGFIGAEFAHVFASLGVTVRIVARERGMLANHDEDIAAAFTEHAREQWDLRLVREVSAARPGHTRLDGTESHEGVTFTCSDGQEVGGEVLLVATGRMPNGDLLNLDAAGIDHDNGRVLVDAHGRTNVPGVWALGDVSNEYQLKHVANHEARVVAHNLVEAFQGTDNFRSFDHRYVPSAVFSHPQVASVGLTEAQARETGRDIAVYTQKYGDVAYGWALEDTTGFVKVIGDKATGTLLGAHMLGPESSSLIQVMIQTMSLGQKVADVARGQYWIHPALAEVVENALLGLGFHED